MIPKRGRLVCTWDRPKHTIGFRYYNIASFKWGCEAVKFDDKRYGQVRVQFT